LQTLETTNLGLARLLFTLTLTFYATGTSFLIRKEFPFIGDYPSFLIHPNFCPYMEKTFPYMDASFTINLSSEYQVVYSKSVI
jgi:hypothetical protein